MNDMNASEHIMNYQKNIFIVFIECETSGNVGFLARAMANFGIENLVLINPCELDKSAYFQAMHGKYVVENSKTYGTIEEFLKTEHIDFIVGSTGTPGGSYNLSRIPITPEKLSETINLNTKIAILFGREGNGLYNNEINLCDIIVSIPTNENYPIMNISHAAAIIFYELFKNKNQFPVEGLEESTLLEKEYLLKDLKEIINTLDIPEHKEKTNLKAFKNIINRAFITGRESHTLKGLFRKIKIKLQEIEK
ncbi:TrmJ/YjtD family RNA methyltransferase [Methanobrevibacter filiformis]|uniref:Putative tRNA/rRNA methyltransferase n=1 Tax=Methanobrevibacter filiformis TaxID=55758 RepID=A0A166AHB9_9EURY|nr:TrmJ/YjtD family RNA methyltransferase [Methanobrevibacter filiformis]KZX12032.1 putative tRNA/rRNA methyltransferase [Methanobrevibacter filiformis]